MYYIEGQSHDPAFNLAMEEHLYRSVDGGHPGYFLLWQNAYTEFYFTDTLWPDMDNRALEAAVLEYQRRARRFGGLS